MHGSSQSLVRGSSQTLVRCLALTFCAGLISATTLYADPPKGDTVKVNVGEDFVVTIKPNGTTKFTAAPGFSAKDCLWFPGERGDDGSQTYLVRPYKKGVYTVVQWSEGDKRGQYSTLTLDATGGSPTPPDPDNPDPPAPLDGPLRVIFVYESGKILTTSQQAIMYGEKVRTYLAAQSKGFRRYDKEADAANETDPDLKALWQTAKSQITVVPCIVVASGKTADIVNVPTTEDDAITLFKKYGGK